MVRAHTVLQSIVTAMQESDRLPESTSYSTWELDTEGGQSNVRPPVVEVTPIDVIRSSAHNTDFVGYVTDDNGNEIGYKFDAHFEMPVQIDVWTAEGDQYDPKEIGRGIRYALYRHDSKQLDEPLPYPDDPAKNLGEVSRFVLDDGTVANDLTMTPALRRWRQTAEVWFRERVEYDDEDYIVNVIGPEDDKMDGGTDVEILYDATPGTESAADNY